MGNGEGSCCTASRGPLRWSAEEHQGTALPTLGERVADVRPQKSAPPLRRETLEEVTVGRSREDHTRGERDGRRRAVARRGQHELDRVIDKSQPLANTGKEAQASPKEGFAKAHSDGRALWPTSCFARPKASPCVPLRSPGSSTRARLPWRHGLRL